MINNFSFNHDGVTFRCSTGTAVAPFAEDWWWFSVSGRDGHRYAPFRAAENDTEHSVRDRIVAYYAERSASRSLPYPSVWPRRTGR